MQPCTLKVLRLLASTPVQWSWWSRPREHASTDVHFSLAIALATPSQCVYAGNSTTYIDSAAFEATQVVPFKCYHILNKIQMSIET